MSSAYEVLSDEKKRRQYDQFGSEGMNENGFNFHQGFQNFDDLFKEFDFGHRHGRGNGFKFSFGGGFDDLFSEDFEDDDDDDNDFFGGFKFSGFGDSFFSDDSFPSHKHRDSFQQHDNGDSFHRTVRHSEFHSSSK